MITTIPFFKQGSILVIHLFYHKGPKSIVQGVCIKKKNKGFNSSFSIKQIINNEIIIQTFQLYSPFIKKIEILSNNKKIGNKKKNKVS